MKNCDCKCSSEVMHDEYCKLASMTMSKARFVDAAENAARGALDAYQILTLDMGVTTGTAIEMAIDEARESASCFVGIGSCGGGGCKHA